MRKYGVWRNIALCVLDESELNVFMELEEAHNFIIRWIT